MRYQQPADNVYMAEYYSMLLIIIFFQCFPHSIFHSIPFRIPPLNASTVTFSPIELSEYCTLCACNMAAVKRTCTDNYVAKN